MVSLASIRRLGNVLGGFRKFGQSQVNRLANKQFQGKAQTVCGLVARFAGTLESFLEIIHTYTCCISFCQECTRCVSRVLICGNYGRMLISSFPSPILTLFNPLTFYKITTTPICLLIPPPLPTHSHYTNP